MNNLNDALELHLDKLRDDQQQLTRNAERMRMSGGELRNEQLEELFNHLKKQEDMLTDVVAALGLSEVEDAELAEPAGQLTMVTAGEEQDIIDLK